MDSQAAVRSLGALAHDHRLAAYRRLVQAGLEGLAAGALAEELDTPASSLSFHLAQLSHAGLVTQRRLGRSIVYAADYTAMNGLIAFLTENCCAGQGCGTTSALACAV